MNKRPLYMYVIAVMVVWAIIIALSWFGIIWRPFHDVVTAGAGFGLGMIAMYIAMHLYRWQ